MHVSGGKKRNSGAGEMAQQIKHLSYQRVQTGVQIPRPHVKRCGRGNGGPISVKGWFLSWHFGEVGEPLKNGT